MMVEIIARWDFITYVELWLCSAMKVVFPDCCFVSSCLEQDLLLVMTHYIEKDQSQRSVHAINRPASAKQSLVTPQVCGFHIFISVTLELQLLQGVCSTRLLCTWLTTVHQSQIFPADVIYSQPLDITWSYHVTGSTLLVVGPSLLQVWRSGTRYRTVSMTWHSAATASDNRWRRTYFNATSTHSAVEMLDESALYKWIINTVSEWRIWF